MTRRRGRRPAARAHATLRREARRGRRARCRDRVRRRGGRRSRAPARRYPPRATRASPRSLPLSPPSLVRTLRHYDHADAMTSVGVPYSIACVLPSLVVIDVTNEIAHEVARGESPSGIAFVTAGEGG